MNIKPLTTSLILALSLAGVRGIDMVTTKVVQLVLVLLVLCPPAAPSAGGVAANASASGVLSFDTGYIMCSLAIYAAAKSA